MRKALPLALAIATAIPLSHSTAQNAFVAGLAGHQEVPSVATLAEGIVNATLSNDGNELRISGEIDGLSSPIAFDIAGGAHIHFGYTGENGPVVLPIEIDTVAGSGGSTAVFTAATYNITDLSADLDGDGAADDVDLVAALRAGRAYVNVHTENYRGGEVRGQLHLTDVAAYDAMLYGEQQNPPVLTDGMGGVMIEITDDSMYVSGSVRVESPLLAVGGTPAHLHFGNFGQNGPVGVGLALEQAEDGLSARIARAENAFARTDGAVADVVGSIDGARNVYVNVHTEAFGSGEVRGQVVAYNSSLYMSYVSDVAPNPAPSSYAEMRVLLEKPLFSDEVGFSGSFSDWAPEVIDDRSPFVQLGHPFLGGRIAFELDDVTDEDGRGGTIPLQTRTVTDTLLEGIFLRTSSVAGFTDDDTELRFNSRFYHECKRAFYSRFTGSQAVPSTPARAQGEVITEYYTNRIELTGLVTGLTGTLIDVGDGAGGMHIHDGLAGRSGGIVVPVNPISQPTDDGGALAALIAPEGNIFRISPEEAARMRERGFYYNLHTEAYPGGEVRGQIAPRANSLYLAVASAGQAVPGFGPSPANGAVFGELTRGRVTLSGTFNELSGGYLPMAAAGSGAHLHGNIAGRTGGVVLPLTTAAEAGATEGEFLPGDNTAELTFGIVDSMLKRLLYVNVHSQSRPAGELRGQVTPLASNVLHAKLSPDVTVPYTGMNGASEGQGHLIGEVYPSSRVTVSGSWDSLTTAVNPAIGGGAHIHPATVAETGGIAFGLNFAVDSVDMAAGDSTSATVRALDNIGVREPVAIEALLAGDAYANVHTVGAPSGAIRGQMLTSVNRYPNAPGDITAPEDGGEVDLGELDSTASVAVTWGGADDPDAGQDVAYLWQLYADTTGAPLVQTQVDDTTAVAFTVGQLDTLLLNAGLDEGESITLFHRASTTDGSLITPGEFFAVTFERTGFNVSVADLPAGSARLLNTLAGRGGELVLEVGDLPAGELTYRVSGLDGRVLSQRRLDHAGQSQRYPLADTPAEAGMYVLTLADEQGRRSSWVFAIQ